MTFGLDIYVYVGTILQVKLALILCSRYRYNDLPLVIDI